MSERYGVPPEVAVSGERGFAVVAYGKLGGIELGYGSDLDLVFLHGGELLMDSGHLLIEVGHNS